MMLRVGGTTPVSLKWFAGTKQLTSQTLPSTLKQIFLPLASTQYPSEAACPHTALHCGRTVALAFIIFSLSLRLRPEFKITYLEF
jgi:hypothetical protein